VQALHNEILAEYPDSLEAMNIQARQMIEDVTRLTRERRFDEPLLGTVQSLPVSFASSPLATELRNLTVTWLAALGDRELENNREDEARAHYDKAKAMGLSAGQYAAFNERVVKNRQANRAEIIRGYLLKGDRLKAEDLLVEWEVEDPRNPTMRLLKSELERPEGMVTVAEGTVAGRPAGPVNVDIYETTNRELLEFIKANPAYLRGRVIESVADKDYLSHWNSPTGFDEDLGNRPVIFVSQPVAEAYCKWRGKRLPTSDEWGLAAGEGRRKYPWGDQAPNDELANFGKGLFGKILPGDSHPLGRTPEGIYHMAGNAGSWASAA
jgi:hypothetical protein